MKSAVLVCIAVLFVTACGPSKENEAATAKTATRPAAAEGDVCDRYFAFVESYAGKQDSAIKETLLKRLDFDKQSLPTRDKKEADEYCTKSLERMERMAG